MSPFARSLRALPGLSWLSRGVFESIQELHRQITRRPQRDRRRGPLLRRVERLEERTLLAT